MQPKLRRPNSLQKLHRLNEGIQKRRCQICARSKGFKICQQCSECKNTFAKNIQKNSLCITTVLIITPMKIEYFRDYLDFFLAINAFFG